MKDMLPVSWRNHPTLKANKSVWLIVAIRSQELLASWIYRHPGIYLSDLLVFTDVNNKAANLPRHNLGPGDVNLSGICCSFPPLQDNFLFFFSAFNRAGGHGTVSYPQ